MKRQRNTTQMKEQTRLPGFSVHGILQVRILEWVTVSFSRGSSQPRDRTQVSHIGGRHFNLWATRKSLVNPKGNQSWIFIEKTDAADEASILWPPDAKSWLVRKAPDAGKDWRQEEKGMTEDEMGWMASLTQWTWAWASSRSRWWTGRPGMLWSMVLQRVGNDWVTELNP